VRLPEPIERLLNPGEPWRGNPRWDAFYTVLVTPGMPAPVVEVEHGRIPAHQETPAYREDVPK